MTAPLALFLTRFSAPPPAILRAELPEPEPRVTMSAAELEAAVAAARQDADGRAAAEIAALVAAHDAETAKQLADARADWVARESEALAAKIDTGMAELRGTLAEGVAAALRPLLAAAAAARFSADMIAAIDRLLADPDAPVLTVKGPADLLEALRAARPASAIEWVADDSAEVTLAAGATSIESRLADALGALDVTES